MRWYFAIFASFLALADSSRGEKPEDRFSATDFWALPLPGEWQRSQSWLHLGWWISLKTDGDCTVTHTQMDEWDTTDIYKPASPTFAAVARILLEKKARSVSIETFDDPRSDLITRIRLDNLRNEILRVGIAVDFVVPEGSEGWGVERRIELRAYRGLSPRFTLSDVREPRHSRR